MYVEDKLIQENIITREHIDELYNLFVVVSENSRFLMTPSHFISIFNGISEKKSLTIDQDNWTSLFTQIDYDKDGGISFQDFLRFICLHLKLIFGETGDKTSINKINSLCTEKEKINFHSIINTIFFKFLTIVNPFEMSEAAKRFQPVFTEMYLNLNKNGEIRNTTPERKVELFNQCVGKLNENETMIDLVASLNNSNSEIVWGGFHKLNKLLSPLNFVTCHYEIINYIAGLMRGFENLAINGIFDKLLLILNEDVNINNATLVYIVLKSLKKIVQISGFIFELLDFCRLNELNYTKFSETDIGNFREFIENIIIKKIILRLNYYFEVDSTAIVNISLVLSLVILKNNLFHLNIVISETNFLSVLIRKIEGCVNSLGPMLSFDNFTTLAELRKCIYYCMRVIHSLSVIKENFSTYFTTVSTILNKLSQIADSLKIIFFSIPDQLFQAYFLVFIGFLTKKTNFDDRWFILRILENEIVTKNFTILARPFLFYIRNLLLTKSKKESIDIIAELKILQLFDALIEYGKTEGFLLSEFLDMIEIIIEEHKLSLISSNIMRDIIIFFEKVMRYYNSYSVKKVIKLLKILSTLKDSIIDDLIYSSDIIPLIFKNISNFKQKESFYFDLYLVTKTNFDTLMLGDSVIFLTLMLQSEAIRHNLKLIKHFTVNNLQNLVNLFHSLFLLWGGAGADNDDIELFEKYKDIPKFNLLQGIIDFFKLLGDICFEVSSYNAELVDMLKEQNFQFDVVIAFLNSSFKEMTTKYKSLIAEGVPVDELPYASYDELIVITQNQSEAEKKLVTTFRFPAETTTYAEVIKIIEKHYNDEYHFYFFEEESNSLTKIKDENDFITCLNNVVQESRMKAKPQVQMKFYLFDIPKNQKVKYITNCINCGNRFELEGSDDKNYMASSYVTPLCDLCKNAYLSQIVSNISLNKSMSLSFSPNASPYKVLSRSYQK